MKKNKSHLLNYLRYWLSVVIIGILVGVSIEFVVAWTEPIDAPPGGNLEAPINISNNSQTKYGMLYLNASGDSSLGLSVRNNVVVRNLDGSPSRLYIGNPAVKGNNNNYGRIVLYGEYNGHIYTGTITQGSRNMFIDTVGNVIFSSNADIVSGKRLQVRNSDNSSIGYIQHTGDSFQIFTNHGTILLGDSGDNVGIGVVSPTKRLEVAGSIKGTRLCIGNDCRDSWPSGGGGHGTLVRTFRESNTFTITENADGTAGHGQSGYVGCQPGEVLVGCFRRNLTSGYNVADSSYDSNDAYYYDKYGSSTNRWDRGSSRSVIMTPDHQQCYTAWCEDDPKHICPATQHRTVAICLKIQ